MMNAPRLAASDRAATVLAGVAGRSSPAQSAVGPQRLESIDLLRGLVMVLMALDHTRDFFGTSGANPRDVAEPALFLTRWITHFCAPIFIFLAGVSAYLYGARGRGAGAVSRFLLTRGLWLILIEFTVVRLGWTFSLGVTHFTAQVIWVIGASMVVLAGLAFLPRWAIAGIGLAMIAGHNLFDSVLAEQFGQAGFMWNLLHKPGLLQVSPETGLFVLYPLIPWAGVMAAGYAFGPVMQLDEATRRRWLIGFGLALTAGFILLRATNLYGDPAGWDGQDGALATALSFVNCEKYPPSLLYLMMTLGPALVLLGAFTHAHGRVANCLITFGRVPLFYYVVHIFLIHALAIVFAAMAFGDAAWLFGSFSDKPPGYGMSLAGVYGVWLCVVIALYPPCRWFAALKQRRRQWWWSYL